MTFDWSSYRGGISWLPTRTIYLTRHGSHSYGTATPTSDLDIRGIAIAPIEHYLGISATFEQGVQTDPVDFTIFELRKFMKLASDANPNALEIVFTEPEDHLHVHPLMAKLFEARNAFLSTKALHTFSGYAASQFKRIKAHRRWLLNPPSGAPTRAEFGLPERTVLPADQLAAAQAAIQAQLDSWEWQGLENLNLAERIAVQGEFDRRLQLLTRWVDVDQGTWHSAAMSCGLDTNFIRLLDLERQYTARLREWQQYNDWKKNRNPARAAMEAQFGFDLKHGAHLVRLAKMCRELLTEGVVRVRRPDAEELLAIRHGAWTFEQLEAYAQQQDEELRELAKTSPLPKQPDRKRLSALCVELIQEMHSTTRARASTGNPSET